MADKAITGGTQPTTIVVRTPTVALAAIRFVTTASRVSSTVVHAPIQVRVITGFDVELPFFQNFSLMYAPSLPMIQNLGGTLRQGGSTILCFLGPADRAVEWQVLQGLGTLTPFTKMTDAYGRASCKFQAGMLVEMVKIGVTFVP